jgi:myo-inositol-1(or 4)-monophosphatase
VHERNDPVSYREELDRIRAGLSEAAGILRDFTPGAVEASMKAGGHPVTEADTRINDRLLAVLPRAGEGWLSEESADDAERLSRKRVWVVDPLDGTKEFIAGIPEWSVSIGLVENGVPVAGGILNPVNDEWILGARGGEVLLGTDAVRATKTADLAGAVVLASRSEMGRGEWDRFAGAPFTIRPMGSVAYKLALVAAGRVDATWTLVPKHEWDIAAGAALVLAAGGTVVEKRGDPVVFNQPKPRVTGLIASGARLHGPIMEFLAAADAIPRT